MEIASHGGTTVSSEKLVGSSLGTGDRQSASM